MSEPSTAHDQVPAGRTMENRATEPGGPVDWRLDRSEDGRLDFIDSSGRRQFDVELRRAFPVSAPEGPMAIVAADGTELAWIDRLEELELPLRGLLEEELARREFVPVIVAIERVSEDRPAEWSVVTDRGPHRFSVAHVDDVVLRPDGGVVITDTSGVRYRIPDPNTLDPRSRRWLDRLA
jgi:hypothetical protein